MEGKSFHPYIRYLRLQLRHSSSICKPSRITGEHPQSLLSMKKGVISKGFLTSISGTAEREKLGSFFRELAVMRKEDRFGLYAVQCKKNTGVEMAMELIKSLYQVCVATFEAMHYEICPYLGTINYFFAPEGEVGFKKMVLETWEGLALGAFNVIETPGNHYTCVEQKENAEHLAGLLCILKE